MRDVSGIGVDIVDITRLRQLCRHKAFTEKVFTKSELGYAKSKGNSIPHLAAIFAAKEAILKAAGTGWTGDNEIEIKHERCGRPYAATFGSLSKTVNGKELLISMSFSADYAIAFAFLSKAHSRKRS